MPDVEKAFLSGTAMLRRCRIEELMRSVLQMFPLESPSSYLVPVFTLLIVSSSSSIS